MPKERKEVVVCDQPPEAIEPQTIERTVYVKDHRPRFVLGMLVGALLIAGGIAVFADQQGSYRSAGARVDHSITQAQTAGRDAAHDAPRP